MGDKPGESTIDFLLDELESETEAAEQSSDTSKSDPPPAAAKPAKRSAKKSATKQAPRPSAPPPPKPPRASAPPPPRPSSPPGAKPRSVPPPPMSPPRAAPPPGMSTPAPSSAQIRRSAPPPPAPPPKAPPPSAPLTASDAQLLDSASDVTPMPDDLLEAVEELPDSGDAMPIARAPSSEVDVELDELEDVPDETAAYPAESLESARELIEAYEEELRNKPPPRRAAQLHFEIARLHEAPLGDLRRAATHYQEALKLTPENVPIMRGARRALLARRSYQQALKLYDDEARITSDPVRKATLLHAKGVLLEDVLGRKGEARSAFLNALELDRSDNAVIRSLIDRYVEDKQLDELERILEQAANAVADDPRHRAALIAFRARLAETKGMPERATELYDTALRLDPKAPGALASVKRLHHSQRRWRDLIRVLTMEAELTKDPAVRCMALYRVGRLHMERLGNQSEAMAALERAAEESEEDPLILEELSRLYESSARWDALAGVLERLVQSTREARERVALLHRIGNIYDDRLEDSAQAIHWYESARTIDPGNVPTIQALARIYRREESWEQLVRIHLGEAEDTDEAKRRAAAHCRAAEIFEVHLGSAEDAVEQHGRALAASPGYAPAFKALARLYAASERWRELIELYERAVDLASSEDHAVSYLLKIGGLYEDSLNEPAQAAHTYRRVLDLDPTHLGAIHALQRATERAGRWKEHVGALELEADRTDDDAHKVALFHRAGEVLDEQLGDRTGALQRFRLVLDIDSRYVPALTSIGRLYHDAGRWEDLLDIYEQELEMTPSGPDAVVLLHKMGELCEERVGREEQALGYYRRALDLEPTHAPALRALTRKLAERNDWAGLVKVLELELTGLEDKPARARTAFRIGELYEERLEDHKAALKAYQQATSAAPDYRPAIDALSRLRAEDKSWGALCNDLAKEAARTPDRALKADALMRQGQILAHEQNEPRKAIGAFEEVLEHDPMNLGALMELEELYRRVGAWSELAQIYAAQARVFLDSGARIGALRARARILEGRAHAGVEALAAVYEDILAIDPKDERALAGLEQIAISTGDPKRLAMVDERLSHIVDGKLLRAAHITRLGESLLALGESGALEAFRDALRLHPESLGATQGLSTLARRMDDPGVLAEAARQEAAVAENPASAARLLVRSAEVRSGRLGDTEGAIRDLLRALELDPDSVPAAELIDDLFMHRREPGRLADVLARAASVAQNPDRSAEIWIRVADLQANDLRNLSAAIGALNRVLRTNANHVPTLQNLAALYHRDHQWNEAVQLLNRIVQLAPEPGILLDAHVRLAELWGTHLADSARAMVSLQAVLSLDPRHPGALAQLTELYERDGRVDDAAQTARRLLTVTTDGPAPERAEALLRLARLEQSRGNDGAATQALLDAIALDGPGSESALEYKALAQSATDWQHYIASVERFLADAETAATQASAYLEIGRVLHDGMQRPNEAITYLEKGVDATGDVQLQRELALRLRMAKRYDQAVETLQDLATKEPSRPDVWREMARTYKEMDKPIEARIAATPLVVLNHVTEREQSLFRDAPARPAHARPGSLSGELLERLGTPSPEQRVAGELLRSMETAMAKLYPPDLESYGLSTRDRLSNKSGHPLRDIVDRLVGILGVQSYELYIHRVRTRGLEIELGSPPMVLVPQAVTELPVPQQIFLLARPFVQLARGIAAVDKLTPRELEVLLASAARNVRERYGAGLTSEDFLDEQAKRISKALGRRARKNMEEVARQYVDSARVDFARFARGAKRTSGRVSALLSDDLAACLEVLRRTERDLQGLDFLALLQSSDTVKDLVSFWASKAAMHLRRHIGMLQ